MRKNAWTTQEEYDFLAALIPNFIIHQGLRNVAPFYGQTAVAFLKKFPARSLEFDRQAMIKVCF